MARRYSWKQLFGVTKARRRIGKAKRAANQGFGCLIFIIIIIAVATRGCENSSLNAPTKQPVPSKSK
jgi:hypothetical protein